MLIPWIYSNNKINFLKHCKVKPSETNNFILNKQKTKTLCTMYIFTTILTTIVLMCGFKLFSRVIEYVLGNILFGCIATFFSWDWEKFFQIKWMNKQKIWKNNIKALLTSRGKKLLVFVTQMWCGVLCCDIITSKIFQTILLVFTSDYSYETEKKNF